MISIFCTFYVIVQLGLYFNFEVTQVVELSSVTIVERLHQKNKLSTELQLLLAGFPKLVLVCPVVLWCYFWKFFDWRANNIGSEIKVDGIPVAKLDVRQSVIPGSGSLDYKINSLTNVTQSTSKIFTVTIPPDTHKPNQVAGTWQAVSDGWWAFLKPLPPGLHTIFYNIRVTPTGALTSPGTNAHFADITYNIQVVK